MATLLICLWSISNIFDTNTFCRSFCYFFLKVVKYDISYSLYIWISHNKGMLFFSYRIAQCLSGPYAVTVAKTTYAIINVLLKNLITKSLQQQPPQNRQQQQQKQQQRPLQQLPHPPPQLKVRQRKLFCQQLLLQIGYSPNSYFADFNVPVFILSKTSCQLTQVRV